MFVVCRFSNNKFLLLSIPGSEQSINIFFLSKELYKATVPETQEQANKTGWNCYTYKFYPWWSVLHSIFVTCWHTAVYSLYGGTFYVCPSGFVRYNNDFVKSRFIIIIEVLFHTFQYYFGWAEENRLLCPGLRYVEVC